MGLCLPAPGTTPDLHGLQYFRLLGPLFAHLHAVGTARDRAGNRQVWYDPYATVLLLSFVNPTVTSLRGLQQTTTLAPVHARCGLRRASLRARSAAASVFDAALLHAVLTSLGAQLRPHLSRAEHAALASLTAVDGSLWPALPRMRWAMWQDDQHRAAKRHVACVDGSSLNLFMWMAAAKDGKRRIGAAYILLRPPRADAGSHKGFRRRGAVFGSF